jgi:hypothetical protein
LAIRDRGFNETPTKSIARQHETTRKQTGEPTPEIWRIFPMRNLGSIIYQKASRLSAFEYVACVAQQVAGQL